MCAHTTLSVNSITDMEVGEKNFFYTANDKTFSNLELCVSSFLSIFLLLLFLMLDDRYPENSRRRMSRKFQRLDFQQVAPPWHIKDFSAI